MSETLGDSHTIDVSGVLSTAPFIGGEHGGGIRLLTANPGLRKYSPFIGTSFFYRRECTRQSCTQAVGQRSPGVRRKMTARTPTRKDGKLARPLRYVRIHADSTGASCFRDEDMPFALVDFSPRMPPVSVSKRVALWDLTVISAPAGGVADRHPVPRRQFNLILRGQVAVQVCDGEVRRFGPGSLISGEDTEGKRANHPCGE